VSKLLIDSKKLSKVQTYSVVVASLVGAETLHATGKGEKFDGLVCHIFNTIKPFNFRNGFDIIGYWIWKV